MIIGIDRTFNVGELYLTVMSYKNVRVVSNSTKENPISIGPIMLHRQSEFREYSLLLNSFKIAINKDLTINEIENWEKRVTFGTDGEKALLKAIKNCFPNSMNRLCYLHLYKNINQKLSVILFKKFSQMF